MVVTLDITNIIKDYVVIDKMIKEKVQLNYFLLLNKCVAFTCILHLKFFYFFFFGWEVAQWQNTWLASVWSWVQFPEP